MVLIYDLIDCIYEMCSLRGYKVGLILFQIFILYHLSSIYISTTGEELIVPKGTFEH